MLKKIIDRFGNLRIAVIGDLMLDVYLWGKVSRISPEAPVPVINITKESCCLGGAANVMRNISTLGASAYAFGVLGEDKASETVLNEMAHLRIRHEYIVRDRRRRTTEKRRVMAVTQQLLREDYEDITPLADDLRRRMVDGVLALIRAKAVDAVIFEDYGKGVLTDWMLKDIIDEAKKYGVITALDPKPGSLAPVQGLTVMKPNRNEAFAMSGVRDESEGSVPPTEDKSLTAAAETLRERWQVENLLISLASHGMALFGPDGVKWIPTQAREVFDVSGAGDTVTATFALAMAAGATAEDAAMIANYAAGVVVGKIGTAPIHLEELRKVIASVS